MQDGSWIDLFKFVRRSVLSDITSGRLTKTPSGYTVTIVQDGAAQNFTHEGSLDKQSFVVMLDDIQKYMNEQRVKTSKGISAERARPMSGRKPVANLPDRRVHKPTDRVDDVVVEQNGGFTVTGADSIENVAGDPDGEHWVYASWDPVEFDTYDLSSADRNFLRKHIAAIAHKVRPGEKPEIDYFTTTQFARNRMDMLRSKHGVPKVTGIRSMQ
jgi:hypothetical protein